MKMIERLEAQRPVADQTKEFLAQWGLKQKYVAAACQIPESVFSQFLNSQLVLSPAQLGRVEAYMTDYCRRNS